MKYCEQCGKQMKDNAKFCPICGAPVETEEAPESKVCPKCGEMLENQAEFCTACGTGFAVPPQSPPVTIVPTNHFDPIVGAQQTTEYLGKIVELEKSVFTQEQMISKLRQHRDSLGHRNVYQQPKEPRLREFEWEQFKLMLSVGGLAAMIGLFVSGWDMIIFWGLGGFVLCLILCIISIATDNSGLKREYEGEMNAYHCAIEQDKKRVEQENQEKKNLSNVLNLMETEKEETVQVLQAFYSKDLIFPKYRNLVAVCSCYEYFLSGRCYSLTGPSGAYNIYENEVRLELICTKLDDVIKQLEQVKRNQYALYQAVHEGNQISQQLVRETIQQTKVQERIANSSETAAFYSRKAAMCAEANAWIGMANYKLLKESNR